MPTGGCASTATAGPSHHSHSCCHMLYQEQAKSRQVHQTLCGSWRSNRQWPNAYGRLAVGARLHCYYCRPAVLKISCTHKTLWPVIWQLAPADHHQLNRPAQHLPSKRIQRMHMAMNTIMHSRQHNRQCSPSSETFRRLTLDGLAGRLLPYMSMVLQVVCL